MGVFSLIRDATDAEGRLFRFVGESESAASGRVKRVEKREGVVTPLKHARGPAEGSGSGSAAQERGREDAEVLLRTALRLVDD